MKTALLNNRYRILQTLGRGGFGETFLAIDTHMPSERKCVLKQLKPIIEEPTIPEWMQERFKREAAILEELGEKHEQIPRLYAYFSEEGKFYLVQEWIEGVTLAEKQQQEGRVTEEEVREILVSILPVLDFIHSRRIIHRDIKPDNIILRASDDKPVLIDFGAVKEAIATAINTNFSHSLSMSIGTPGYMPSEQAAGRPVYSSDLYSLGLSAIFLLTGKSPQDLETDSQTGEILWRRYAPNMHSNLATVLDKTIRFHPRDRFPNAKEMLSALDYLPRVKTGATRATAVVAPVNISSKKKSAPEPLTENTVAISSPNNRKKTNKGIGFLKLLLGFLFMGGIGIAAFVVGFGLFLGTRERSPEIASPPSPSIEDETIPTPAKVESPESEGTSEAEPIPETEIAIEPEPPEVIVETPPETPQEPEKRPEVNRGKVISVPAITTGVGETQLVSSIGEPTTKGRGYWQDSQKWSYKDYVPNQVDLTYVFDTDTGTVRESGVSFAQSVDLRVMQKTLNDLLGGNAPESALEALKQVHEREENLRSFQVDNLKVMIQLNSNDRIYITVREADFH